ncbi:MAG: pyridoxamine 5'-phosphate oxidase family protein [Clostridia bacterium]|nr:pyridoxamine 5'-phosphate oxidase family protein [Clostridia bacterium]
MFREMRRSDRKIDDEPAVRILEDGVYGVLSTIGSDGCPYGVPVGYVYIKNRIYIHCARTGHKLDNIRFNDKVSFCVVAEAESIPGDFSMRYSSVIVFGKASELTGDVKKEVLMMLIGKYSAGHEEAGKQYVEREADDTAVIMIEPLHITGKART